MTNAFDDDEIFGEDDDDEYEPSYDTRRAAFILGGFEIREAVKKKVRALLEDQPMTDEELWHALGIPKISTVSSARNSLMNLGIVGDFGLKHKNRSGFLAVAWQPGENIPLTTVQKLHLRIDELEAAIDDVIELLSRPSTTSIARALRWLRNVRP